MASTPFAPPKSWPYPDMAPPPPPVPRNHDHKVISTHLTGQGHPGSRQEAPAAPTPSPMPCPCCLWDRLQSPGDLRWLVPLSRGMAAAASRCPPGALGRPQPLYGSSGCTCARSAVPSLKPLGKGRAGLRSQPRRRAVGRGGPLTPVSTRKPPPYPLGSEGHSQPPPKGGGSFTREQSPERGEGLGFSVEGAGELCLEGGTRDQVKRGERRGDVGGDDRGRAPRWQACVGASLPLCSIIKVPGSRARQTAGSASPGLMALCPPADPRTEPRAAGVGGGAPHFTRGTALSGKMCPGHPTDEAQILGGH